MSKENIPTESHSEKEILQGCISLMQEQFNTFMDYLEFVGIDVNELSEEERPCFNFSYFHLVKMLFLWHTTHRSGTSTMAKCRELGVNSGESVTFELESEEE